MANPLDVARAYARGLRTQVKGLAQPILHPVQTAEELYETGKFALDDPRAFTKAAVGALRDTGKRAFGSAEGFAEVAGENISPVSVLRALRAPALLGARSTIKGARGQTNPGIYEDPKLLAQQAEQLVAPETGSMERLFGVTRADLAQAAETPGSAPGVIPGAAKNSRGTQHGELVTQASNTRRLRTGLEAAREYAPNLFTGMKGWYIMDPAHQRLVSLVGPEEAARRYERLNALNAMASPGSDVITELLRGGAANRLSRLGRFDDFDKYAGMTLEDRLDLGLPEDLLTIPSHAYHKTAQSPAMRKFLETGASQMKSPKVPLYMQAALAQALGRQSDILVGDAHWSRGTGLPDVRPLRKDRKTGLMLPNESSVSTAELQELAPWWREQVAAPAGLQAVPGQAVAWGLYSPRTGVDTPIGAPKLELMSDLIEAAAKERGISPADMRDMYLLGDADLNTRSRLLQQQLRKK